MRRAASHSASWPTANSRGWPSFRAANGAIAVAAAFAEELTQHGGTLLDVGRYENARADFSDIIKQILQVHGVKGEPATHRTDADFVFIAGAAGTARLIVPQLKFNYAGDVPVYATSDSFEPDPSANADLDGMFFVDMPWMVSADPVTGQIRDSVRAAWPARTARRDRLYAFGFDAYRLVPALRSKSLSATNKISGVTGKLSWTPRIEFTASSIGRSCAAGYP